MVYEIKKVLCNKVIAVSVIVAFCYGIVTSYYDYISGKMGGNDVDMSYESEYEGCKGKYTEDKYNHLAELVSEKESYYSENPEDKDAFMVFQKYQDLFSRASIYHQVNEYREKVKSDAKRLADTEKGYYERLNKKLVKLYGKKTAFNIHEGTTGKDITDMFIVSERIDMVYIALLIIFSCGIFLLEHRNGTYAMVYSSYNGRGYTYIRKMAVSLGFAVLVSVLQTISMVGLTFIKGGAFEWKDPIQSIELFMHSPYNLDIFGMVVIITLFRALAYMVLISIFTVISLFFQRNLFPLAINILVGLGMFGLCYLYSGSFLSYSGSIIQQGRFYLYLRQYSPYVLIGDGVGYLKKYEALDIFGYPVSAVSITVLVNIIVLAVCVAVGYILYLKRFRKRGV